MSMCIQLFQGTYALYITRYTQPRVDLLLDVIKEEGIMADFAIYDKPTGALVLGRSGVELWVGEDEDAGVRAYFLPDGEFDDEVLPLISDNFVSLAPDPSSGMDVLLVVR